MQTEAERDCLPEDKPFILTDSGRRIFFQNPDPAQIDIEDAAWGLARESRFGGQTRRDKRMYSAGQHSVYASWLAPSKFALQALLHETSEGLGMKDVPAPLKSLLPGYKEIELEQMQATANRFGFSWPMAPEVKQIDLVLRSTERRDLMTHGERIWTRNLPDPLPFTIEPWPERGTVRAFLNRWQMLTSGLCEAQMELEFQKPLLPAQVLEDLKPTVLPDFPGWPALGYTDERTANFIRGNTGELTCTISLTPLTPEQPRLFHLMDVLSCIGGGVLLSPTGMLGVRRVISHLYNVGPDGPGDVALATLFPPERMERDIVAQHPWLSEITQDIWIEGSFISEESRKLVDLHLAMHGPLVTLKRANTH